MSTTLRVAQRLAVAAWVCTSAALKCRARSRCAVSLTAASIVAAGSGCSLHLEQRDMPSMLRRGYNTAFYARHSVPYRAQAAIHIAHAVEHDYLALGAKRDPAWIDAESDLRYLWDYSHPPRLGPEMMAYGPHTGQAAWRLYQAIDWTHEHHDQTYDILADSGIPWDQKERVTSRAVEWYLEKLRGTARSPAPLDITLRRAAVMMKPYATLFRTQYPASAKFFFFAHWWHPAIYEAMMIAGNDREQEEAVNATHGLSEAILRDRPERMLLSREIMPRYARLSPESANIFDNLHMLHGIAYDILAYADWSMDEKRAELYRVIDAMSEKPGDRELSRRFPIPHPEVDPRCYEPWMRGMDGEMSRIMQEMLEEMWPMMSPDGASALPVEVQRQARLKLTPGMQAGEFEGSLHDALMKLVPSMKMNMEAKGPGRSDPHMVEMMVSAWQKRASDIADVQPLPTAAEPSLVASTCTGSSGDHAGSAGADAGAP